MLTVPGRCGRLSSTSWFLCTARVYKTHPLGYAVSLQGSVMSTHGCQIHEHFRGERPEILLPWIFRILGRSFFVFKTNTKKVETDPTSV